jgi:hypothetical protein
MKPTSRRSFLRGGLGIAISLPWLELMHGSQALAQSNDPTRLFVVFHGNGVNPTDWFPSTTGADYELRESLLPLAEFKSRMHVTAGLSGESAKAQGGNPHTKGAPHLLTGSPHIDGQFTKGGGGGFATSISFDQEVARLIRDTTPIPSLVLGPKSDEGAVGETPRARISYLGHNQPVTPEHRPSAVFDQLTRQFSGADDPALDEEAAQLLRRQRRSVLDFVADDVSSLQKKLGTSDRARLDEYLTHLREIEASIPEDGSAQPTRSCDPPGAPPAVSNVDSDAEVPRITTQMMQLSRLALQCDLTRVVTFQWCGAQSPLNYSKMSDPLLAGVKNAQHHNISHDGPFTDITKICKWHSEQVAALCRDLDSVSESDGKSLLDNTLVLYCNELSDGERHSFDDLPFVLIGGASGKLQTGRFSRFAGKSNNDLLATLLRLFGAEAESFGDARYNSGLLSGLLA